MRNILAICAKEWRMFFSSATVLSVAAGFWLMAGVFFFDRVRRYNEVEFRAETRLILPDFSGALPPELSIEEQLLAPFLSQLVLLLTVFVPIVTMRVLAEEKRTGTLALLFTTKVTVGQLALGKFLACWLLLGALIGVAFGFPVALTWKAGLATGPLLSVFVGLLCVAAALVGFGLFCSSLTNRQSVAVLLTYVGAVVWYDFSWAYNFVTATGAQALEWLALSGHMDNFSRGVLSGQDLMYYVGAASLFLILTSGSLLVSRAG
jgi:ABC-2 type transport system permease protein